MLQISILALGTSRAASAADLLETYHAAQAQDAVFAAARGTSGRAGEAAAGALFAVAQRKPERQQHIQ